jgi:hypothetical protein
MGGKKRARIIIPAKSQAEAESTKLRKLAFI